MGQTFRDMGWQDREVKVNRDELLSVLRKNREQHIAEHIEAMRGYLDSQDAFLVRSIDELKGRLNDLREGKKFNKNFIAFEAAPVSHEQAYDQIIRMMEMSVDQEISLTASQFGCFVMDDWEWKKDWVSYNSRWLDGKK